MPLQTIFPLLMAEARGPLGVAVSGGSDSLALMMFAAEAARAAGRDLLVLTVDHGLRAESAAEVARVAARATALGLRHRTLVWQRPRPNQAAARRARHALLAAALRAAGGDTLLLGHTLDDQRETLLMRARSGSGWFGMAAMDSAVPSPAWPEGRRIVLARPLLTTPRAALRQALADRRLPWIEDPANADPRYERVRMRALLAGSSGLVTRIDRVRGSLGLLRAAERRRLAELVAGRVRARRDGSLAADLDGLPAETGHRLLSMLLAVAAGHDRQPDAERVRRLLHEIAAGGPHKARTLAGAWTLREAGSLLIARDPGAVPTGMAGRVFDGRFARDQSAPPLVPTQAHRMARRALPPDGDRWRPLAAERLQAFRRAEALSRRLDAAISSLYRAESPRLAD